MGWEESRLSRYDIRAEGALPPSITVIARECFLFVWVVVSLVFCVSLVVCVMARFLKIINCVE